MNVQVEQADKTDLGPTGVVNYTKATELAAAYRVHVKRITELILELGENLDSLNAAYARDAGYGFRLRLDIDGDQYNDFDERSQEKWIAHARRNAWKVLIEKLGIRSIMSSKRQKELDEVLNGKGDINKLPPISEDTILSVLEGMVIRTDEFLNELIAEEMEWLLPVRGWGAEYKTNQANLHKLTGKLIKTWTVENKWGGGFRVRYQVESHVRNVDNIFHMLDGKGLAKGHNGPLVAAIETTSDGTGETEYFRFRVFSNGNLHLWFKRADLVSKFNELAATGAKTLGGRTVA